MTRQKNLPTPRPSATVILIRRETGNIQVYLLKRSRKSGFMAGNYVFPGGVIDPEDRDTCKWSKYLDMKPEDLPDRFGTDLSREEILCYGMAAIRETFEESGVLIVGNSEIHPSVISRICQFRNEKSTGKHFQDMMLKHGFVFGFSYLFPWSHWITPLLMPKRYETRFFLARMPLEQNCSPDFVETVDGIWLEPKKALEWNMIGKISLSPPTLVTLHQLLDFETEADLIAESGRKYWGETIMPRLVISGKTSLILEPWDPEYHEDIVSVDQEKLSSRVLPVGKPFSRLWNDSGIWKPVEPEYPF